MGMMLPVYCIGIVLYLVYTLMKVRMMISRVQYNESLIYSIIYQLLAYSLLTGVIGDSLLDLLLTTAEFPALQVYGKKDKEKEKKAKRQQWANEFSDRLQAMSAMGKPMPGVVGTSFSKFFPILFPAFTIHLSVLYTCHVYNSCHLCSSRQIRRGRSFRAAAHCAHRAAARGASPTQTRSVRSRTRAPARRGVRRGDESRRAAEGLGEPRERRQPLGLRATQRCVRL